MSNARGEGCVCVRVGFLTVLAIKHGGMGKLENGSSKWNNQNSNVSTLVGLRTVLLGMLRQENHRFQASLNNLVSLCVKIKVQCMGVVGMPLIFPALVTQRLYVSLLPVGWACLKGCSAVCFVSV